MTLLSSNYWAVGKTLRCSGWNTIIAIVVWGAMPTALRGHAAGTVEIASHAHARPWAWHPVSTTVLWVLFEILCDALFPRHRVGEEGNGLQQAFIRFGAA